MKRKLSLLLSLVGLLALTACLPGLFGGETPAPGPTVDPNVLGTSVVQTVSIRQTIAALETQIGRGTTSPVGGTPEATATRRPPTATVTPSPTLTPSATVFIPTATSTSSIPCNAAKFVKDMTYEDGSVVTPEQNIVKTWRIQNVGSCGWSSEYALVFASGEQMGGADSTNLTVGVKPGEYVDLSVNLTAPKDTGNYTGYWQMRAPDGSNFGTGNKSEPFWVKITVGTTTITDTILINNFCTAVWKNNGGTTIPCPAQKTDFKNGSVFRVNNPKLEGGSTDDEPALVTIPADGSDGKITGTFPAFKVQSGDQLITLLGCMDSSPKCSVTFKLSYTIDGNSVTDLGTWDQVSDGSFQRVGIDLSSLAGQSVKFIFSVSNKDGSSTDDQAFWLNPYIKR